MRKLQEYLKQDLPDPLSQISVLATKRQKQEALKEIAGALQHYSDLVSSHTAPKLYDRIPHDEKVDCWAQIQRFRICIYGTHDMLQVGNVVHLAESKVAVVEHFTKTKNIVQVVLRLCKSIKDHGMMKTAERFSVTLGLIEKVVPAHQVSFSPLEITEHGEYILSESSGKETCALTVKLRSYLSCRTKMLHQHDWVLETARFIHSRLDSLQFTKWIRNQFQPFVSAAVNDNDCNIYAMHRMNYPEGQCSVCKNARRIVFAEGENVCEPCYVRIRTVCGWFPDLEQMRRRCQARRQLPASNDSELEDLVEQIKLQTK